MRWAGLTPMAAEFIVGRQLQKQRQTSAVWLMGVLQ